MSVKGKWISILCSSHTMENDSAVNRNRLLIHPNTAEPAEHYSEGGEKDMQKHHTLCVPFYMKS